MIRSATADDAAKIVEIYNHYVVNSAVTFEEKPITEKDMALRIAHVCDANLPWLVLEHSGDIIGYAYATKWKARSAYRFSVESTVYLASTALGQGLGKLLYDALFEQLRHQGVHCVVGGITLPNAASVKLHEKMGMQKVAHFKEIGFKFGQWRDVGYWQLNLEGKT